MRRMAWVHGSVSRECRSPRSRFADGEAHLSGGIMRYLTFTLWLLVLPSVGSAHHSRAEFADEVQQIEGQIVEIAWRNPHPVLTVSVTNDAGEAELWELESWSSANSLARKGVVGDVFEVGQTVRAAVRLSGRRPGTLLGESISLGNGTQAVLRPGYDPVFPGEAVLGSDNVPLVSANASGASGQDLGLFRVWSHVESEGPGELPLTAAAIARQATFDELVDHPMWNCDPVGMPVVMDTGAPIEFIDRGDEIHLRLEQNDSLRVIHLNSGVDPASQPHSIMGYSAGRWEGDTLVVTTRNTNYPFLNDDGAAKSDAMQIDERFTLGADGNTLSWEATLTDPVYLTESVATRKSWEWVPGEALKAYECLESSSGIER